MSGWRGNQKINGGQRSGPNGEAVESTPVPRHITQRKPQGQCGAQLSVVIVQYEHIRLSGVGGK